MRTLRYFSILTTATALTACVTTAQMVASPGDMSYSRYAPVNEATRSGIIKYLNNGADFLKLQRREDAYQQMHAACLGKYRIDAEGPNSESGNVLSVGTSVVFVPSQYWYIQFSCVL